MNRLLISYDLRAPGRNYEALIDYITNFPKWAKPLESVWVAKTNKSYDTVRDEMINLVDSNDKLLVVDITGCAAKWYNIPPENWIKNNQ